MTTPDVLERQVEEVLPSRKGLQALMKKRKIRLYLGVDPTSPNLHLGHAVLLRKLQQFQELGHEAILLFGTFTARIGDPSGRDQARQPLFEKEINENIRTYRKQAGLILDMKRLRIKKNHVWLSKMRAAEVQELASHVTAAQLLERDMFEERRKRGQAIWIHEMLYPLLQGYDSVAMDVDLEIGGTDQTFNMLVGRELQRAYHNKEKYILTTPLLLGPDGRKMSKSLGNTINLLDSSNEMYGKLMSIKDELVPHYFELCTDVPEKEQKGLSARDAKAKLAKEIVRLYHGEKAARTAEREFERVFQKKGVPSEIEEFSLASPKDIVSVLVGAKLASSKSQAWRLIRQKGVKFNGSVVQDPAYQIQEGGVVQVGKRYFVKVVHK